MLSYFKQKIIKIKWALKFAVLLSGVKNAIQQKIIMKVVSTWVSKPHSIIVYCHFHSHLQNVMDVILELASAGRNVMLILAFKPESNILKTISRVTVVETPNLSVMSIMRADLLITPVVSFQACYAPHGSFIVHFLVSLTSLDGVYEEHHFDDCDYIFCAGAHQIDGFVKLSKKRNLAGKVLIPGGYPKLDSQIMGLAASKQYSAKQKNKKVVVYAPTHVYKVNEELASLRRHGEDIVKALLSNGFAVVFRPHPNSFIDEDKPIVEKICVAHEDNPCFYLDKSKNYMEAYAGSDLMVTDLSGTGFTFAFTFQRPVIFFVPDADAEVGLEGIQFHSRHEIGDVVRSSTEIGNKCLLLLAHQDDIEAKINRYRDKTVFNLGASAKYFCHCLPYIERGEIDKGWVVL